MRRLVVICGVAALAAFGALVGCQGYEFEVVKPKAVGTATQSEPITGKQMPAKLMLVLDRSTSMMTPVGSNSGDGCGTSSASYRPNSLDCKWNTLKQRLTAPDVGFLARTKDNVQHGLLLFTNPKDDTDLTCGVGSKLSNPINVEIADGPGQNVGDIAAELDGTKPGGGTPTAAALGIVAKDNAFAAMEPSTRRYVLLITDGLPNCNSQLNGDTCVCTGASQSDCRGEVRSCLDDNAMVQAVKNLHDLDKDPAGHGIDTFVVGFGAAFADDAAKKVLNDAAIAGGQPNTVPDPDKGLVSFYLADTQEKLDAVLDHVIAVIQACNFQLTPAPSDPQLLEVTVTKSDGSQVVLKKTTKDEPAKGDWYYDDADHVAITGTDPGGWCYKLQNDPPGSYTVNFLTVKSLGQ